MVGRGSRTPRRSSAIESASRQRSSVSGKCWPMSPSPAAPSSASMTAWVSASASEWPLRPRSASGTSHAAEHERPALLEAVRVVADARPGAHPIASRRRDAAVEDGQLGDAEVASATPPPGRSRGPGARARGRRWTAPPAARPRGTSRRKGGGGIDLAHRLAQPGGGHLDRDVGLRDAVHRQLVEAAQVALGHRGADRPRPSPGRGGRGCRTCRCGPPRRASRSSAARPSPGRLERHTSQSLPRMSTASSRRKWTEPTT